MCCVLWAETDWCFALETALIADIFFRTPPRAEKALRDRERVMGATFEARRHLRIRYVPVEQPASDEVQSLADYRAIAARHEAER